MKPSGIGGQAVLEGIMMRNRDRYAVAVRKPDGTIAVDFHMDEIPQWRKTVGKIPIVRGVVSFVTSLVVGMQTLTYSASFYEDEEPEKEAQPDKQTAEKAAVSASQQTMQAQQIPQESQPKSEVTEGEKGEAFTPLEIGLTVVLAIVLAVGIFILLPYGLSLLAGRFVKNVTLLAFIEGVFRLVIFLAYVWAISLMDDIKRTYMYHGSEHKCINCIESGQPLTVENVRNSSRFHKRCGTSFLLVVMVISIVIFSFIRARSPLLRLLYRLLLIPVVAGVSYEFLQWAGRSDNAVVNVLSKPGLCLQRLTTREPTDDMIEVAITAVERVFDWQAFLDGKPAEECFPKKKTKKVKKAAAAQSEPGDEMQAQPEGEAKAQLCGETKVHLCDETDMHFSNETELRPDAATQIRLCGEMKSDEVNLPEISGTDAQTAAGEPASDTDTPDELLIAADVSDPAESTSDDLTLHSDIESASGVSQVQFSDTPAVSCGID